MCGEPARRSSTIAKTVMRRDAAMRRSDEVAPDVPP
jgi:hypothetical protein